MGGTYTLCDLTEQKKKNNWTLLPSSKVNILYNIFYYIMYDTYECGIINPNINVELIHSFQHNRANIERHKCECEMARANAFS